MLDTHTFLPVPPPQHTRINDETTLSDMVQVECVCMETSKEIGNRGRIECDKIHTFLM